MKLIYIMILVSLFSLPFAIGNDVGQFGGDDGDVRNVGNIQGLVNLNERSGISHILGNLVSMRDIVSLLGLERGLFDLDEMDCHGVHFCGDTYDEGCSSIPDGVCPEIYGDWRDCNQNIYGGLCIPCDPDCDDGDDDDENNCGHNTNIIVPNVKSTNREEEVIRIIVRAEAYGYPGRGIFILFDTNIENWIEFDEEWEDWEIDPIGHSIVDCDLVERENEPSYYLCANNFEIEVSGYPTDEYYFWILFLNDDNEDDDFDYVNFVTDCGIISPYVEITIPNEEVGFTIEENIELTANVWGNRINGVVFSLYNEEGYVDTICQIEEILGIGEPQEYSCNFNPNNYENGDYRLDAMAIGRGTNCDEVEPYVASVNINIDNPPPPPEEVPVKILNLVLAKIKSWI